MAEWEAGLGRTALRQLSCDDVLLVLARLGADGDTLEAARRAQVGAMRVLKAGVGRAASELPQRDAA